MDRSGVAVSGHDDPSLADADVVARRLEVEPAAGLTEQEAARRLEADGLNEPRGKKTIPSTMSSPKVPPAAEGFVGGDDA